MGTGADETLQQADCISTSCRRSYLGEIEMPIKAENKARYPSNWKEIRLKILERAEDRCEFCKAPNRTRIARGGGEDVGTYMTDDCEVYCDETGEYLGQRRASNYDMHRMTDIVLTIAHLDHEPENCDPENLKALCQKCHLNYDKEHHKRNAAITRHNNKNITDMFGGI